MSEHHWYSSENTLFTAGALLTVLVAVSVLGEERGSSTEMIFVPAAPAVEFTIAQATLPELPSLAERLDLTLPVPEGYSRPGAYEAIPAPPAFTAELPEPDFGNLPDIAERIVIPALEAKAYPGPGPGRH